jgi:hypothetical protein
LVVSSERREAVYAAVRAAGPQCRFFGFFGYRGGGYRSSHEKRVKVNIVDAVGRGNRYRLADRTLDGEKALTAALRSELAAYRRDKRGPQHYFLRVKLEVEVKPGVTATEGQILLARKTVAAAAVGRPEKKQAGGGTVAGNSDNSEAKQ